MTVSQLIAQFRHLVLEHPDAAHAPVYIAPHGDRHQQAAELVHLNYSGTRVVVEAGRK